MAGQGQPVGGGKPPEPVYCICASYTDPKTKVTKRVPNAQCKEHKGH
jgi:hypothetical protein